MNSPPIVTTSDEVILLGDERLGDEIQSTFDPDGDDIVMYRFRDENADEESAVFKVNDIVRAANVWFDVAPADLFNVVLHAATSIQRDFISVRAFDGTDWSPISSFYAYTARENTSIPVATIQNFTVVSEEFKYIQDFIASFDPDGWPITKFRFSDLAATRWGGFFIYNGTVQQQGVSFEVPVSMLHTVRFRSGAFGQSEIVRFEAYDGVDWSFQVEALATTKQNANRPEVFFNFHLIKEESTVDLGLLFEWFDLDNNTGKRYRFFDTSSKDFSGDIFVDGIKQSSKTWIEIQANQLNSTQFFTASKSFLENLRVRVFDGRFWSAVQTIQIQTITKPTIESTKYVVSPQLQTMFLSDLFTKLDEGPPYLQYELYDGNPNPLTGNLVVNGDTLAGGVVHTLSASEFSTGLFRTGTYFEGSFLDDVYARAFNGTFWSDWRRVSIRTESEFFISMTIPDFRGAQGILDWNTYLPPALMETFTYSFAQEGGDQMSDTQRAEFRKGFDYIESIIDVEFVEVRHFDPTATGTGGFIRISTFDAFGDPKHITFGPRVHIPGQIGYDPFGADMMINEHDPIDPDEPDDEYYGRNIAWVKDGFIWNDFLKMNMEMMGFRSPSNTLPTLPESSDNHNYSIMSENFRVDERLSRSFSIYDINALQTLYNPSQLSGGDNLYDIAGYWEGDTEFVDLIYDYDGIDTLDLSALTTNDIISIRPGDFSSIGGLSDNLAIALNTVLENVTAGSGDNQILGNEEDNVIVAGDGNDIINGQGGDDLVSGGRGNDTYDYRSGDDRLTINEDMGTGNDKILFRDVFGFDSFTEDLSFRKIGNDLFIDLTYDGEDSGGQIIVKDMGFGTYRVETLELLGVKVDLKSVFDQATNEFQQFTLLEEKSDFGFLTAPV